MKNLVRTIPYPRPGTKSGTPWAKIAASLAAVVGILAGVFQARRK